MLDYEGVEPGLDGMPFVAADGGRKRVQHIDGLLQTLGFQFEGKKRVFDGCRSLRRRDRFHERAMALELLAYVGFEPIGGDVGEIG